MLKVYLSGAVVGSIGGWSTFLHIVFLSTAVGFGFCHSCQSSVGFINIEDKNWSAVGPCETSTSNNAS